MSDLVSKLLVMLSNFRREGKNDLRNLVTVVLGEIDTRKARTGVEPSQEEIEKFIRKMVSDNKHTLDLISKNDKNAEKLQNENNFLETLLPSTLTIDEIVLELEELKDCVVGAVKDGAATGIAMKHLRSKGLSVLGSDVSKAVVSMRSQTLEK